MRIGSTAEDVTNDKLGLLQSLVVWRQASGSNDLLLLCNKLVECDLTLAKGLQTWLGNASGMPKVGTSTICCTWQVACHQTLLRPARIIARQLQKEAVPS